MMKSYFTKALLLTTLLTSIIAAFNGIMNPYLMFNSPVIKHMNEWVTENYYKQLLFKVYQLHHIKPVSIILGASQAGVAFNPEKLPQPAYNLSVGGSTSYIHYRLLQEAIHSNPQLQSAILETPFFAFNSSDPNNQPDYDLALENRLNRHADGSNNWLQPLYASQELFSSLISWDVTRASLRMIAKQHEVASKQRGSFIQLRNGQWIQQTPPAIKTTQLIENSWKKSIFNDWLPAPDHQYVLPDSHHNAFLYYRKNLQLLYSNNIDTKIVIAPFHASLHIALQENGLWQTFHQWKKELVIINEAEAKLAGKPPFSVYDYAVINDFTSEEIPPSTQRMQWFNDSMHPSPALGDIVMDEIMNNTIKNGRQLNNTNLNALQNDGAALSSYIDAHTEQQTAIRQMIQDNKSTESGHK
jgi:hypothetical protein